MTTNLTERYVNAFSDHNILNQQHFINKSVTMIYVARHHLFQMLASQSVCVVASNGNCTHLLHSRKIFSDWLTVLALFSTARVVP
jgi:hypothetical protein